VRKCISESDFCVHCCKYVDEINLIPISVDFDARTFQNEFVLWVSKCTLAPSSKRGNGFCHKYTSQGQQKLKCRWPTLLR